MKIPLQTGNKSSYITKIKQPKCVLIKKLCCKNTLQSQNRYHQKIYDLENII